MNKIDAENAKIVYCALWRQHLVLKSGSRVAEFLRSDSTAKRKLCDEISSQTPSDYHSGATNAPPKSIYRDCGWSRNHGFTWPIVVGDSSPLSPDGEPLERLGKIGLDFWHWQRDSAPLGYTPPLCTCNKPHACKTSLAAYVANTTPQLPRVCEKPNCRGLLYIPYSLIEVSLNRRVCNAHEFAQGCRVPDDTDIYCGSMKHTIVLCTVDAQHESQCIQAIKESVLGPPLMYKVVKSNHVPFFTLVKTPELQLTITVDSQDSLGIGQVFAIAKSRPLQIYKYNVLGEEVEPLDDVILTNWLKPTNEALRQQQHQQGNANKEKQDQSQGAGTPMETTSESTPTSATSPIPIAAPTAESCSASASTSSTAPTALDGNVQGDFNNGGNSGSSNNNNNNNIVDIVKGYKYKSVPKDFKCGVHYDLYRLSQAFAHDRRPLEFILHQS